MRQIILLLLALCVAEAPAQAAGWKLVFQDQFDGDTLDRSRWATRYIYNNETFDHLHGEAEVYRDNKNHLLSGGILSLVARPVGGGRFESGMIRSRQTFYYGYFEARVFFPKGKGIWPAFWLNPDYDAVGKLNWPPEIDVFEYAVNGKDDTSSMVHSAASTTPSMARPTYLYTDPDYSRRNRSYTAKSPLNEGWHVFGLAWAPDRISVFLDGKRLYTRPYQWLRKDGTLGGPAHILLNFAVGGSWAGRYGIDQQLFPQALRVDYVRVCQFTAGSEGQRNCGNSPVTPDPAAFGYRSEFNDLPKPTIGVAKTLSGGSTTRVSVPIVIPDAYRGDRVLRVSLLSRRGGDKPLAVETLPLQISGPGRITPQVELGRVIPTGDYVVTVELLTPAQPGPMVPTPVTCTGPEPLVKALKCQAGTVSIRR